MSRNFLLRTKSSPISGHDGGCPGRERERQNLIKKKGELKKYRFENTQKRRTRPNKLFLNGIFIILVTNLSIYTN